MLIYHGITGKQWNRGDQTASKLNKRSQTITSNKEQGAAQAMLYGTPNLKCSTPPLLYGTPNLKCSTPPLLFKIRYSQNMDLRCILLSDPSTLGVWAKHVSNPVYKGLTSLHLFDSNRSDQHSRGFREAANWNRLRLVGRKPVQHAPTGWLHAIA